jgi:hypothetical protein
MLLSISLRHTDACTCKEPIFFACSSESSTFSRLGVLPFVVKRELPQWARDML